MIMPGGLIFTIFSISVGILSFIIIKTYQYLKYTGIWVPMLLNTITYLMKFKHILLIDLIGGKTGQSWIMEIIYILNYPLIFIMSLRHPNEPFWLEINIWFLVGMVYPLFKMVKFLRISYSKLKKGRSC